MASIDLDNPGDCKPYADLYERTFKELQETKKALKAAGQNAKDLAMLAWFCARGSNRAGQFFDALGRPDSDRGVKARDEFEVWWKGEDRDHVVQTTERDDCGCLKGRHPLMHWTVAPDRWVRWAESLLDDTTWTCGRGWPVPRPTDDPKKYEPPKALYKEPRVDPNHKPEARNLCICCDCNGHEVVPGSGEERCRICKLTQAEIDALEKDDA